MLTRFLLWLGCLLSVFFLGCVSKTQFNAVSSDYQLAQERISQLEKKLGALELSERESKVAEQQCRNTLSNQIQSCRETLDSQVEKSQNEFNALSEENKEQRRIIKGKQATIALQQSVIRLVDDSKKTLQTSIQEQIDEQNLEPAIPSSATKVVLVSKLLFESGSASLSDEAKELLGKLTGLLTEKQYTHIRIQGHTDSSPFRSTAENIDNWSLSAARATAVARFIDETLGVPPGRISATAFGPYRPIASNDTAEGRKQNRRIEIILEETKQSAASPI